MIRRLLVVALAGLLALVGGRIALLVGASGTPDAQSAGTLGAVRVGQHRTALVFGAGLSRDGTPSPVLRDRIRAGARLLERGKVDLLLMSGDNSVAGYSEPSAMRTAAIAQGVPAARIAVDYGGRRTWDSCARARRVFGIRRAVVVTNDFHRARTIELCKAAGIDVVGAVGTPTGSYAGAARWQLRELVASWRGVVDAWIVHPTVAVGGGAIDPYDPCAVWRSLSRADRAAPPGTPPSLC